MSCSALIEIHFYKPVEIFDIMKLFEKINWSYRDTSCLTHYLPIGDTDDFNYKTAEFSDEELKCFVNEKLKTDNTVFIEFFYTKGNEGFTMCVDKEKIVLFLSNNRHCLQNVREKPTDYGWYSKNIIVPLFNAGAKIATYSFDDTL
ncbi:MAG: hypothetical protein IJR45_03880 [Firmicutes bacterium]|nr:hypothetical protein [Clostridia bacterium]MBQ9604535.1 hypothetical protein [Bacillota bacterium]